MYQLKTSFCTISPAMSSALVIKGIPETLHVPDLRVFFEPAVEQGLFACFHFRREKVKDLKAPKKTPELTCRVRASSKEAADEIIHSFHNVPWCEVLIDADISKKACCLVERVNGMEVTRTVDSFELHPPPGLPQGNVGTSRSAVLSAIRACKLPASVIKRLGLVPWPRLSRLSLVNVGDLMICETIHCTLYSTGNQVLSERFANAQGAQQDSQHSQFCFHPTALMLESGGKFPCSRASHGQLQTRTLRNTTKCI